MWVCAPECRCLQARSVRELGHGVIGGLIHWMWVLGSECESPGRAICVFHCWTISLFPHLFLHSTCKVSAGFNRRNKTRNDGGKKWSVFPNGQTTETITSLSTPRKKWPSTCPWSKAIFSVPERDEWNEVCILKDDLDLTVSVIVTEAWQHKSWSRPLSQRVSQSQWHSIKDD